MVKSCWSTLGARFRATAVLLVAGLAVAGAALNGSIQGPKDQGMAADKDRPATTIPTPKLSKPEAGVIKGALVQRDTGTNRILRVRGEIAVAGARTPEQAADRFLRANAATLGLSSDLRELQPVRSVDSLTGRHMTYQQVLNGLPVLRGRVSVHTNRRMAVTLVNNDSLRIKAPLQMAPLNKPGPAIETAIAAVKPTVPPTHQPKAEPGVFVQDDKPILVWQVTFDTITPPGSWEVLVGVVDGKVLSVINRAKFVDGDGMVFIPNPVLTSGNASLADNDDADSPTLDNERKAVKLLELDGSGYLQGPYCTTAPTNVQPRANEPSFTYNYTRFDDRFEEVMSYYHIDTNQRYIQSLGFTTVNNRQQGINVNGSTADNSWYTPSTGEILYGTGGVDDAEDADIILHEYGHSIQDNQVPGFGATLEGGAMGEGFGDYWGATTFTGIGPMGNAWDIYVGEWDAVSYSSGNPPYLRRLDSPKHYPEDMVGEVHDDGEIWSACLWQIRGIVGAQRSDTMILESHFRVSPYATFQDGALAILAANHDLYADADADAILQVFVDRGILTDPRGSQMSVASLVAAAGQDVTLSAKLTRQMDGSGVPGKSIDFSVDGTPVGSAVTDADGNAALPFTVPPGTPASDLAVQADWVGDAEAFAATGYAVIYVLELSSISGAVTDSGTGMAGVDVTLVAAAPSGTLAPNLPIPDGDPAGTSSVIEIKNSGNVGSVKVALNITHTWIGDLQVALVHPDGTTVLLHDQTGGSADNINTTYPTLTAPAESLDVLKGKPLGGPWTLAVRDQTQLDAGVLVSWSLSIERETPLTVQTTTAPDGSYTASNLEPGNWSVTPTLGTSAFKPATANVSVPPSRTGVDFALNSFTIGGTVRLLGNGLADVPITLTSPADKTVDFPSAPGLAIPDNNTTGIETPLVVPDSGTVTSVSVGVNITHPYIADLEVSLIHPDGTRIRLHNRSGGNGRDIVTTYPVPTRPAETLNVLVGKPSAGTWKLRVRDLNLADTGTLNSWTLTLAYSGTADRTTTTGPDGTYTFADCLGGTHVVTPSHAWMGFTPASQSVVVGPHQLAVDFAAIANPTTLALAPAAGLPGASVNLTATLTDTGSSTPLPGMDITFTVDGTAAGSAPTNASGVASVGYSIPADWTPSNKQMAADFAGSNPYLPSSAAGTLTVLGKATSLSTLSRTGIIGTTVDLRGYLRDKATGATLEGKTVAFTVDGSVAGQTATDASGRATLPIAVPGPVGDHPLTADFAGDAVYSPSSASATITATTSATTITMNGRTAKIADQTDFKAFLFSLAGGAKALPGKTVAFSVDGTQVGSVVTNSVGRALMIYGIPDGAGAGDRTILAQFAGDGGYLPSEATATLTVLQAPLYIWPYAKTTRAGDPLIVRAFVRRLYDYQWLPGRTIAFKLDGTDIGTSDSGPDGIAWFNYPDTAGLAAGNHTITASFAGDAWVAAGSGSSTFKILAP